MISRVQISQRLEAAEAAGVMLREEVEETRQALAWREEELGKIRTAKAESEVPLQKYYDEKDVNTLVIVIVMFEILCALMCLTSWGRCWPPNVAIA